MRCPKCFKLKDLVPLRICPELTVCKACNYELESIIGFMEFYGFKVERLQPTLPGVVVQEVKPEGVKVPGRDARWPAPDRDDLMPDDYVPPSHDVERDSQGALPEPPLTPPDPQKPRRSRKPKG